jgi:hypothetical protein
MQNTLLKGGHDVSDEPRDEGGKWTEGGGGGGEGEHPGAGYSKNAYVDSKGVIHTSNVYDAQRALFEDRKVELNQVKQISTLIKRLGETAAEMAEHGETAPTFNLCNVSVKGTNLLCADQIGIPRVEMPVIRAGATKDFIKYLKKQGYAIEKGTEESRNLRATQNEISGTKVAAAMQKIKERGFYKRLVVSRDDYILDGHHTWAGQLALDAKDNDLENDGRTVKIARVDISITKLIAEAEKWTGGKGKKPASEAPKNYQLITLKQAQQQLDPATYRKFADVAYRFLAANGHLARGFDDIMITVPKEFDPDEPRDEAGKWTEGGGGEAGGAAGGSTGSAAEPKLDPEVIKVGGDEWNRATAKRLETQYQNARPEIDKLAREAPGASTAASEDDEDEEQPFEPEEWDQLSGDDQEQVESQWKSGNESSYYDSEVQSWHDSGGSTDDAKSTMAYKFNDDFGSHGEWAPDALIEYRKEREDEGEADLPFTNKQILESMRIEYDSNGEGTGKLDIGFDPDKLQQPIGYDPAQQSFPGIEAVKPEDYLTEEMRDGIEKAINEAFNKKADDVSSEMDAPDYLHDNVKEFMEQSWDDKDDEDKFNYAKHYTDVIKDKSGSGEAPSSKLEVEALPKTYDPLNDTSGQDYQRTQKLARYLSVKRAVEVLLSRPAAAPEITGTEKGSAQWKAMMEKRIATTDSILWSAWKASSTTTDGKLLQVAAAAELGGRLNKQTRADIDANAMRAYADKDYKGIGGWAGVRAYVRAKWETTQYLLDKAGIKTLGLYRGITFEDRATFEKLLPLLRHYGAGHDIAGYRYMPTLDVLRNGAASTTTDPGVANDWGAGSNRVVLRASVPRTAALSVPAFGINVQSEHEVVVTGTAWHGWDAWAGKAPTFDKVPLKVAA